MRLITIPAFLNPTNFDKHDRISDIKLLNYLSRNTVCGACQCKTTYKPVSAKLISALFKKTKNIGKKTVVAGRK
jgi:hypothetical protein